MHADTIMCWDLLWSWVGAYSGHGLGPVLAQFTVRLLILACGYHHVLGPTLVMGWGLLWSWAGGLLWSCVGADS